MENILVVLLQLSLVIFLVLLNGFFVASEFAIVKVRTTRIAQLLAEGNLRARITQQILTHLDAYLSATQLGITLASLGLGWIGEPFVANLLEPVLHYVHIPETWVHIISFTVGFTLITFLHIVLGEMAPKSIAIRNAEGTVLRISRPLHWFFVLFRPAIWFLNASANKVLKWMGVRLVPEHQQPHTEQEIRMLVEQSHESGILDQTEHSLLDNVFDFTERIGREVMVARINMVCVYTHHSLTHNLSIIRNSQFTRFPLCGRDKDDILGIIHTRDIYEQLIAGETPELTDIARKAIFVPETMEIKDILRSLQKKRTEMAIVIDEYGGTSGLITIEDIIEEIVGEIQDEFDNEEPFFLKKGKATSIDAQLLIEEVNEYFNIEIEDEDNDTIGGWVFSQLQELPKVGSTVDFQGLRFIVQEMKGRSVTRLTVQPLKTDPSQSESPST